MELAFGSLPTARIWSLVNGGEMGARMRALGWSATVLGPLLSASLAARPRMADALLTRIEPDQETER